MIATGAGILLAIVILGGVQINAFVAQTPNPKTLPDFSMPASTLIYDRHGTLLYSSYDNINRIPVPLSQVPVFLQNAIIAAEDKRFYSHWGIDPLSIVQAGWYNLTHEQTHGASTITQQLAKNVFLSEERTIVRKLQEAIIALRIERNFTKREILELYFNTVSF
ncbi:MAG: transglycosylase domain-containing protein, partial [Candidatus Roizmanbacteria bacterium]|nr:transglycosylase domain-containing protein [Candidatus Roizmanbacteria bacterium]